MQSTWQTGKCQTKIHTGRVTFQDRRHLAHWVWEGSIRQRLACALKQEARGCSGLPWPRLPTGQCREPLVGLTAVGNLPGDVRPGGDPGQEPRTPGSRSVCPQRPAIPVLDVARGSQFLCSYHPQGVASSTSRLVFGSIKKTDVKINNKL